MALGHPHSIPSNPVPDDIPAAPCVKCLYQFYPGSCDGIDFFEHFQPATELSCIQRIDRTVFNLGHQGMYVDGLGHQGMSNPSNSDTVHHASLLNSANRREPLYSFALEHADQHRIRLQLSVCLLLVL